MAIVIGFPDSKNLAKKIANKIKAKYSELEIKRFPDNESYIRFKINLKGKDVIFVQSLNNPDEKIIHLIFASETARDLGAKKVILIAPYLAYMRQDKRFKPGECISSKILGKLLKNFDKIITVDPHLHRYKNLKQILPNSISLSSNKLISDYIKKKFKSCLIIGPDIESYQWAEAIARYIKTHAIILQKTRFSSRKVRIKLKKNISLANKDIVIVDDIISTGHTMIEVIKQAKKLKANKIFCIAVHGLNIENAYNKLKKLGVKQIISTNTVQGRNSFIDVSNLISSVLK